MGRQVPIVAAATAGIFAATLAVIPVGVVARTSESAQPLKPCETTMQIGAALGGVGDQYFNEVVQIEVLRDLSGQTIGWFYTLRNHQIWFAPALTLSGGNLVPSNQSLTSYRVPSESNESARRALQRMMDTWRVHESRIPPVFQSLLSRRLKTELFSCVAE